MAKILTILFGDSFRTSIWGYVGAIATAIIPILQTGTFALNDLVLPAVIAILGRVAGDDKKNKEATPSGN